jgi:hypothetical protein
LARKVDKKSSEILELARSLGFEVKTASSSITEEEADKLLFAFEEAGDALEDISEQLEVQEEETTKIEKEEIPEYQDIINDEENRKKKTRFGSFSKKEKKEKAPKIKTVSPIRARKALLGGLIFLFVGLLYLSAIGMVTFTKVQPLEKEMATLKSKVVSIEKEKVTRDKNAQDEQNLVKQLESKVKQLEKQKQVTPVQKTTKKK